MNLKNKHVLVISLSSLVVAIVLVSTLIVYSLYLDWKEDSKALQYNNSIYRVTADMFAKYVAVSNVNVNAAGNDIFRHIVVIEGSVKNNSDKTITSLMLEVSFSRPDGTVIYRDWLYPIGDNRSSYTSSSVSAKNVLSQGEGVSFRHILVNCPAEVAEGIQFNTKFAKIPADKRIQMEYEIAGMSVL